MQNYSHFPQVIIISPYSARLRNGQRNPKNYPHFPEVIDLLKAAGFLSIQIGVPGEARISGAHDFLIDQPPAALSNLVSEAAGWISVDNFFPHFCNALNLKPGVVLFGQSNPQIFGYPHNVNLLKSVDYLRARQFDNWETAAYSIEAFVEPEQVIDSLKGN